MIVPGFGIISHVLSTYSKKPVFGGQSMIYAMASIGLLGFLVWSQMVAFPFRKIWVINITICWYGTYLLTTFYSLNVNILSQSAGNLRLKAVEDTSETKCDGTYDLFWNMYKLLYNKNNNLDKNWLTWFIGFVEGDGAILNYNNQCRFVITQRDINILYEIKNKLGFGKIILYKKNNHIQYGRYIITSNKDCILLYLLFNKNLCLNHRISQLERWYPILTQYLKNTQITLEIENLPCVYPIAKKVSLNDAWLSGFTDAEGCFSITKYKNRDIIYIKSRFILDQQDEFILNTISLLLYDKQLAKLRKNQKNMKNHFRIEISCNNKFKNKILLNYFNKYNLRTSKYNSYLIFKSILTKIVDKQPLPKVKIQEIDKLRKEMNKYTIDNKPIGHKNKS